MHHPGAGNAQRRCGTVRACDRDNLVFGDVAVRGGNQPLGRSGAGAGGGGPDQVSTDQQVLGIPGNDRAAIGGGAVAGGRGADIQGVERIDINIRI